MQDINDALQKYDTYSLENLMQIPLLDRKDSKYIFHINDFAALLDKFRLEGYKVLKIDEHRIFNYESMYFDTDDYKLYHEHHNGKMNRYKVRYRRYIETDTCFFEIKFKNNKGRTIKKRISDMFINTTIEGEGMEFVEANTPYLAKNLDPKLLVFYKRITLASLEKQERFTIDLDLSFFNFAEQASFPEIVIAELKQDITAKESVVKKIFRDERIHPLRMSKYCIGMVQTYGDIKYNNFKEKIHRINKIRRKYKK